MTLSNTEIQDLLNMEWLDTNSLGGSASSSISGANTRKYHGLLVAAFNPPTDKRVLLAKVEERIHQKGEFHDLSVNQFPGTIYPEGHRYLNSFERRPIATWNYGGKSWKIQKKVFMVPNSNTVVLIYENMGSDSFDIELHPLLVHKNHHATSHENHFDFYYEPRKSGIKVHAFPDSPALYLKWSKGTFDENRVWYKNFELPKEEYRGQDAIEDYYRIGFIKSTLKPGQKISVLATIEENMVSKSATTLEKKTLRTIESKKAAHVKNKFYNDLLVSGDQFLVNRASTQSKSIIAGYHWFADWGRDTMIAMRGLTIATGNKEASKSILSTFFKYLNLGMLPNRFPDFTGQDVEYNTIDASLWLFIAMYEYHERFKDKKFIEDHLKELEEVLIHHIKGTRFNIHLTEEGFIYGGQDGWQLTWMDARVDGYVVTPRIGCPIEINALWYNAMCIYEHFCQGCNLKLNYQIREAKSKFLKNFKNYFLNDSGFLNDVVVPNESHDGSFRPNQIHVVSLPFSLLNKSQEKKLVQLVGEKLLTDYGLRTLDDRSPQFIGHYGGNQWDRDIAYHQGTVWPFLLMEYWEAFLKVNKYSEKAKKEVIQQLKPLKDHFYNSDCLHAISEIFDGVKPDEGRGCVQQAWSVAALIKLYTDHQLYKIKES